MQPTWMLKHELDNEWIDLTGTPLKPSDLEIWRDRIMTSLGLLRPSPPLLLLAVLVDDLRRLEAEDAVRGMVDARAGEIYWAPWRPDERRSP